jgi:hypothetical protein
MTFNIVTPLKLFIKTVNYTINSISLEAQYKKTD